MRKIMTIAFFAACSTSINAQSIDAVASTTTDTVVSGKSSLIEERLKRLDERVLNLQKENNSLKKEVYQLKTALPNKDRKFSVSRKGSKQVVVE
jgi:uncharacterized protein YlxW (UPF0749 family)